MARKIKRTCIVCGKEYTFCPHCKEDSNKPSWMVIFDSQDCHDIFDAVTGFKDGIYDKETAKGKISNCKLEMNKYSNDIAKTLKEITKKEAVKKTVDKAPVEGETE